MNVPDEHCPDPDKYKLLYNLLTFTILLSGCEPTISTQDFCVQGNGHGKGEILNAVLLRASFQYSCWMSAKLCLTGQSSKVFANNKWRISVEQICTNSCELLWQHSSKDIAFLIWADLCPIQAWGVLVERAYGKGVAWLCSIRKHWIGLWSTLRLTCMTSFLGNVSGHVY